MTSIFFVGYFILSRIHSYTHTRTHRAFRVKTFTTTTLDHGNLLECTKVFWGAFACRLFLLRFQPHTHKHILPYRTMWIIFLCLLEMSMSHTTDDDASHCCLYFVFFVIFVFYFLFTCLCCLVHMDLYCFSLVFLLFICLILMCTCVVCFIQLGFHGGVYFGVHMQSIYICRITYRNRLSHFICFAPKIVHSCTRVCCLLFLLFCSLVVETFITSIDVRRDVPAL